MTVNEVLLSQDGDATIQFVELFDPNAEGFPNDPYRIDVYDADATLIDSVTLPAIHGETPYYIASAQAVIEFGVAAEAVLDFALPIDGQVCFVSSTDNIIQCLAYGCVNTLAGTALETDVGPTPADGESVQRQAGGVYHLAAPTPDATNAEGVMLPACPGGPDAGVAPDANPEPDANPDDPPDANTGGGGNNDDDGGGCCQTSDRGAAGSLLLGLGALVALRRRRRSTV
jgi:hypothetical protein